MSDKESELEDEEDDDELELLLEDSDECRRSDKACSSSTMRPLLCRCRERAGSDMVP